MSVGYAAPRHLSSLMRVHCALCPLLTSLFGDPHLEQNLLFRCQLVSACAAARTPASSRDIIGPTALASATRIRERTSASDASPALAPVCKRWRRIDA
eukprot:10865-Pelagococcus_subviridis.AAC.2